MTWFHLALLSAAAKAGSQAITKTLTWRFGVLQIAAFGQIAAGCILLPAILMPGMVSVPVALSFHKAAWVTISLNIIAIIALTAAIRQSDLSYSIPFLSLTPVFTILSAFLLRGEEISPPGLAGIAILVAGALSIDARGVRDWISLGGVRVLNNKGVLLVLLVAAIYSVSSVFDKTATLHSDPVTFTWYSGTTRAVIFVLILLCIKRHPPSDTTRGKTLSALPLVLFVLLGSAFVAESLTQMAAMQTGLVSYVIAVKRLSILLTSILGMTVYREPFSWHRLIGAGAMVSGATVLYFAQLS